MKFLHINSDRIVLKDIPWGLVELGEDVDIYQLRITLQTYVQREKEELSNYLSRMDYDAVITHNFAPPISDACEENGVKYISWIFDSPQFELYAKSAHNKCNYFFVFDRSYVEKLKDWGLQRVIYQPLAANVSRTSSMIITEEDVAKFSSEISFVGNLYHDNFYDLYRGNLQDPVIDKLDQVIEKYVLNWNKGDTPMGKLGQNWHETLCQRVKINVNEKASQYIAEAGFLARKISQQDRVIALTELSKMFHVDLYTKEKENHLGNVLIKPAVMQDVETQKVYHLSKINLNLTLRSIETGVPKRVFDIMSAGGFVLSNYQEEMEDLFVPDKEIVLFHNMEELKEKVTYFLTHEKERVKIAYNGFLKVKNCYSYPAVLSEMIKKVENI